MPVGTISRAAAGSGPCIVDVTCMCPYDACCAARDARTRAAALELEIDDTGRDSAAADVDADIDADADVVRSAVERPSRVVSLGGNHERNAADVKAASTSGRTTATPAGDVNVDTAAAATALLAGAQASPALSNVG